MKNSREGKINKGGWNPRPDTKRPKKPGTQPIKQEEKDMIKEINATFTIEGHIYNFKIKVKVSKK